jgi:hypothetical protein
MTLKLSSKRKRQILKLYTEFHTVYGKYKRKDGRKIVILYNGEKRSARQYAKVKLEIKIKRRLRKNEEVDHKDNNFRNDKFSNLQVLTGSQNRRKSTLGTARALGFKQSEDHKRNGDKNGKSFLTNKQVKKCRNLFYKGLVTRKYLQKKYKITDRTLRNILNGTTYVNAGGKLSSFSRKKA